MLTQVAQKGKGTLNSFIQQEIHLVYLVPLQKLALFTAGYITAEL